MSYDLTIRPVQARASFSMELVAAFLKRRGRITVDRHLIRFVSRAGIRATFEVTSRSIAVTSPPPAILNLLLDFAQANNATVVGEEGEEYFAKIRKRVLHGPRVLVDVKRIVSVSEDGMGIVVADVEACIASRTFTCQIEGRGRPFVQVGRRLLLHYYMIADEANVVERVRLGRMPQRGIEPIVPDGEHLIVTYRVRDTLVSRDEDGIPGYSEEVRLVGTPIIDEYFFRPDYAPVPDCTPARIGHLVRYRLTKLTLHVHNPHDFGQMWTSLPKTRS